MSEDDLDNLFGGLAGALVRALATPLLRIMEGAGGSDSQVSWADGTLMTWGDGTPVEWST